MPNQPFYTVSPRKWLLGLLFVLPGPVLHLGAEEKTLNQTEFSNELVTFTRQLEASETFTWWFPADAKSYVLPISAGIIVDTSDEELMTWLRKKSPWSLMELPALGIQYGDQMVVVIVPRPHYAEIVIGERLGIRFSMPDESLNIPHASIVTSRAPYDPLIVARTFRSWRQEAVNLGAIPRSRTLSQKMADTPTAERLLGAPHLYLWGPALFSSHDVSRNKWVPFAKVLNLSVEGTFGSKLRNTFSADQRNSLEELSRSDWPIAYLTQAIAEAINSSLVDPSLLDLPQETDPTSISQRNKSALQSQFSSLLQPIESWGDGLSISLLDSLHEAGVEKAVLVLSNLYAKSARPEVARHAEELGYLIGPYDSYHSIHSPEADPDDTWETAQFDLDAFDNGRVINPDGSGHSAFKGTGYHFSPEAAWPHVQKRVNGITTSTPYSTWFIDCDATGECFDDYSPSHKANKFEDSETRRHRLDWLEKQKRLVIGSEGGSVIFSDVIHYGHGVNTPYIGHQDPGFSDRQSPYFLGRHWPPHEPAMYFKSTPVPPSLISPYFDPTVRIPLYQAALGDQLVTTHHWNFDSLKFSDIEHTRELIEILYMIPPMYHLNRNAWENRKDKILKHLAFWSPIHRKLAPAPLTKFVHLSEDRLVQRTTYTTEQGEVTITVNFSDTKKAGFPSFSASVTGSINLNHFTYSAYPNVN